MVKPYEEPMFILHPDLISRAALSAGEIAKPCLYLPLHHQSSVDLLSPRYLQQEHADDKYGGVLVRAGSPCWCARRFVFFLQSEKLILLNFESLD